MNYPNDDFSTADIASRVGYRDKAEAWQAELLAASEETELWENEENLQIAAMLALKFSDNRVPQELAAAESARVALEAAAAFHEANGIVREMQKANFLGLNNLSKVRNDRLKTAAVLMVSDKNLRNRYQEASFSEKQALLEKYSQITPELMRGAQQSGAGSAMLSAALQSLFPAAAARSIAGIERVMQDRVSKAENENAAENVEKEQVERYFFQQAAEANRQTAEQKQLTRRQEEEQKRQEQVRQQTPLAGRITDAPSPNVPAMPQRAHSAASWLVGGGVGTVGALGFLAEFLTS